MKKYLFLVFFFVVTACSDPDESTQRSEPAGIFASVGILAEKDAQSFSSCSVESLAQQLPLNCKILADSAQTHSDSVETGSYTFTLNNESVASVRLTRTSKASVACEKDRKLVQKGVANQTTSVIYVHNSKVSDFKSCDNTTPVWIKNKSELESGEVLEDVTIQLVYAL